MQLALPDDLLKGSDIDETQLLFDLALGLYVDNRLGLGRAAMLAGIPKSQFLDELGKRKISVHYDNLQSDLKTLQILRETGKGYKA